MSKKIIYAFLTGVGIGIVATVLFSDPDGNLSQVAFKKKMKKLNCCGKKTEKTEKTE